MKRSTKAILLSALVYPGAGHWYLEKKWTATLFMLAATAALYVLIASAWSQTNLIAEQITSGEIQPEIGALLAQMAEQTSLEQSGRSTMAATWIGIVWFTGILDAWRISRVNAA